MTKEKIIQKLKNFISENKITTYAEIEDVLDELGFEWRGAYEMFQADNPSICIWAGWNEDAIKLINELLTDPWYKRGYAKGLAWKYNLQGKVLQLPVASDPSKHYEKIHWLPLVFQKCGLMDVIREMEKECGNDEGN